MTVSETLFKDAQDILVGGVNSPVRAFKAVGGTPLFMKSGAGSKVTTEDGATLIDYVLSWGPLILGHADPDVTAAVTQAAQSGSSFGAPVQSEIQLAKLIQSMMPSIEKIRFVSSGTEATMSALRVARGATKRKKIIKFEGCYHGHSDGLLVSAGSGALTLGAPTSDGVLPEVAEHTIVLPYNDIPAVAGAFQQYGADIAAVIVEPVAGNMGLIPPVADFLQTLRSLCTDHDAVLIFDEVMCGFRVHLGGAQALYNVKPDMTCLGKVIGGGMPCAAFGGKSELMNVLSPEGPVYQAGTLSGNPVAMAAGIATLTKLKSESNFDIITQRTQALVEALNAEMNGRPFAARSLGTMWGFFLSETMPESLESAKKIVHASFGRFYHDLIECGIYIAPSAFEANFMSLAHSDADIQHTIRGFAQCMDRITV